MSKLRITPQVLDRLNFFANGPVEFKETEKKAVAFYGVLYGLRVKELSEFPIVLNITGNPIFEDSNDNFELEILTELFPVGIDPVGAVYLSSDDDPRRLLEITGQMAEKDIFMNKNVIMMTKCGSDEPTISILTDEGTKNDLEYQAIELSELEKFVTTIRLRGKLELLSSTSEREIISWIQHTIEKVSCPYGSFRLQNSDVFFLHSFEPVMKGNTGWTATESFKQEFTEECHVSNIDSIDPEMSNEEIAETYTIVDLWKCVEDEDDFDDGFGTADAKKKQKRVVKKKQTMDFSLLMKMSGDACTSRTRNCAPVIHYEKVQDVKVVKMPLNLDGLAMAPNDMKIVDVMELLKGCAQRQVHIFGGSILSEFKKLGSFSKPEVFHLKPEPFGHFVSLVYTKTGTCQNFTPFRLKLHRKFLLKPDRPYFRRLNKFTFEVDRGTSGPLNNVHIGLAPSGVNGEVALVQGTYTYHHYMQDNFDDNGWGCAYRSLQTLISWFRHQGYVGTSVPSHEQIQKCLVDIGDKERSFIGSRQWIGSTEVGFVLEKSCDVQCKFLSVSSGEDLENKGRELAHHFKTNGTPIMIGN